LQSRPQIDDESVVFDRACGRVGFSGIHSAEQSCLTDVALRFKVYVAAPRSMRAGNSFFLKPGVPLPVA